MGRQQGGWGEVMGACFWGGAEKSCVAAAKTRDGWSRTEAERTPATVAAGKAGMTADRVKRGATCQEYEHFPL